MAIYSFNLSNVSRKNGANTCACLAYISGETIKYERLEKTYTYGHKDRIVSVNTFLPNGANEKYYDPEVLMNRIESVEKNDNSLTARKIIVALPRELTPEQRNAVLQDFVKNEINDRNFACVVAIHDDPEDKNPHAHILIPNRPFEKGDFAKNKRKSEYALDADGNKIPILDENGKQKIGERGRKLWVRVYKTGRNPLDQKDVLKAMREGWEKSCNKWLKKENQIDHRSFKERGISKEPTIHEGYKARMIEKKGKSSDRCEYNRAVMYLRENNIDRIKKERDFYENEYKDLLLEEKRLNEEEKTALKSPVSDEKAAGYVVIPPVLEPRIQPIPQEILATRTKEKESSHADDGLATKEKAKSEKQEKLWLSDDIMRHIAGDWINHKAHNEDIDQMRAAISRILPDKIDFSRIDEKQQERLCEAANTMILGYALRGARIKTPETARRVFSKILESAKVPEKQIEKQEPERRAAPEKQQQIKPEIVKLKQKDKNRGFER